MKNLFIASLTAVVLMGCAPLIIGAGAAAGYVGVQERSFKEAGEDIVLKTKLMEKIGRLDSAYLKDLNISVRHGEAFITGVVDEPGEIARIEDTTYQVQGVDRVINAVQLKPYSFKQYMADVATGTNLRSRLVFTEDVYSRNYDVTIVKGEVYLFGWAYTQQEIDQAVHIARTTKGVERVHNYLRVMENGRQKLEERKHNQENIYNNTYGVDEVR